MIESGGEAAAGQKYIEDEELFARISTGSPQADQILGGGFPADSISVIMGPPGTGSAARSDRAYPDERAPPPGRVGERDGIVASECGDRAAPDPIGTRSGSDRGIRTDGPAQCRDQGAHHRGGIRTGAVRGHRSRSPAPGASEPARKCRQVHSAAWVHPGSRMGDRARNRSWAAVSVSDTGPGIPPDQREAVFEPYPRLSRTDGEPGSGLGLAICRELVRHLGGHIDLETELGHGSTFTVRLPLPAAAPVR
jgi:hypothetical protein